jgi:uncharacterized protein
MKPLDFGGNGINGSLDANGRIIALNFYHPEYGYVTLTSADPFPDDKRYDQAAVRAYRKSLTELEGFGFTFDEEITKRDFQSFSNYDIQPCADLEFKDKTRAALFTSVLDDCVFHICDNYEFGMPPRVRFKGRFSLQRCAYTQLTEGGPIPAPPVHTRLSIRSGVLTIENPAIGCVVIAGLSINNLDAEVETDGAISIDFEIDHDGAASFIVYAFGRTHAEALHKIVALNPFHLYLRPPYLGYVMVFDQYFHQYRHVDILRNRGLIYSYNLAVPVNEGVCLLTDHMLLPLSWNRDAYYAARALLSWHVDFHDRVRRHLIWMFEIAERIDGAWARCYLANGKVKDGAFQLDQQLFPLLELAEYILESGYPIVFLERLRHHVQAILDTLLARKADFAALFPTDETPADDPIALPYHLSSHILFWKVLDKLKRIGLDTGTLADDIRAAVDRYFIAEHDGKRLYAYATDGKGRHHFYHDANDFPTVLAPIWGWCSADDPVWRATIDFAFSEDNRDGFYQGHVGSVHTRAPWPLGDVQELIVGQITGDQARIDRARASLRFAAQPDGALPEAYDAETGEVVSRHWFAWPNAAYACVELGAFKP